MSNAVGSLEALKATDPDVYAAIIAEESGSVTGCS